MSHMQMMTDLYDALGRGDLRGHGGAAGRGGRTLGLRQSSGLEPSEEGHDILRYGSEGTVVADGHILDTSICRGRDR